MCELRNTSVWCQEFMNFAPCLKRLPAFYFPVKVSVLFQRFLQGEKESLNMLQCDKYWFISSIRAPVQNNPHITSKTYISWSLFSTLMASPDPVPLSNFSNREFVSCAQRVVQVSATTTDGALWRPAAGTASANQDGEGRDVTWPWKPSVPTARTTKEVYLCSFIYFHFLN